MDQVIEVIKGVGEIGIDTDASPGLGRWYVKHYASGYDVCGFDCKQDAIDELMEVSINHSELDPA